MNISRLAVIFLIFALIAPDKTGHTDSLIKGSGIRKSEERDPAVFDSIEVNGIFDVFITFGQKQQMKITGDENILPHIATEVAHGKLLIHATKSFTTKIPLTITLKVKQLRQIKATGSTSIETSDIESRNLVIKAEGASEIHISGKAETLEISASDAGRIEAGKLLAENAKVYLAGSGEAAVHVRHKLYTEISEAASLICYGKPLQVSKRISEAGSLVIR